MRDPRRRKESGARNYFVLDGARTCTVSEGLGWGHMPDYMVADELGDGRLISFANRYFRGSVIQLVAARKVGRPHGPIASKLWDSLRGQSRRKR